MSSHKPMSAALAVAILAASLALLATVGAVGAHAATGIPWWRLNSTAAPTFLPRTGEAQLLLTARNVGDGEVDATGEEVTLTDELPPGITPVAAEDKNAPATCSVHGQVVTCTFTGKLAPYAFLLEARITVKVKEPTETPLLDVVKVQGGHTPPATLEKPLKLEKHDEERTPFGVETYELLPEDEHGAQETQAGSHPFQLTTVLDLNQTLEKYGPGAGEGYWPSAPALPRNVHFKLPPGLLGDPGAVPECSATDFSTEAATGNLCPEDTAVGVAAVTVYEPKTLHLISDRVPVFNLQPAPGEPARFGFAVNLAVLVPVVLRTAVPSGGGYGVQVSVEDASQAAQVLSSEVTLWGVPGDARHNASRGWGCLDQGLTQNLSCEPFPEPAPKAFLTLPTSCKSPPETSVSGESWPAGDALPALQLAAENTNYTFPSKLTGCDALEFDPSILVEPEQHSASAPTGLDVGVAMPQPGLLAPEGRAESALKATTVRFPPGLTLNPSAANALEDCAASEFGFLDRFGHPFGDEGVAEEQQTGNETFESPFSTQAPGCKDAAKVGTVNISTPLLPHELTGSVYLAAQNTEPFKSPLALYLLAEDPAEGVRVKLAGSVVIEPDGQVISTFQNTPQVPFTSLKLHLFGGERASQSTPPQCGPATTTSEFVPWSGGAAASPSSTFQVNRGVGGGACPSSPLPFSPSFKAGPSSPQAGAFSPFVADIGRPDGQQALTGISLYLPSGFAAVLASVTPCPEPQAGQEWQCGESSRIGEAHEYSGLGEEPVMLTGQVYLTSGYDGAPFGLLVRTLAKAGPFDLGWVNVRSRINVDPNTAAVTVTSDPGPRGEAIPSILDGVPVQLKALEVAVNRPDFEFNPTSCNGMEVTGTLGGSEGAAFGATDPFKAEGCEGLAFHPALEAFTTGQASKANGASLTVRVSSQGLGVANIAKTKLTLPRVLPSRLTTIQKACPDSVFQSTPAAPGSACDEGSQVGRGVAHTPVLKAPLEGPAFLVSHGGAAFPDVEFVLKAEGILLVLDGKTDIVKGITTSEFNAVPDAPVTSFEAILPDGPHSALGAYVSASNPYDLCGTNLMMPTIITGQNGAVIEQETHINVTGCAAVKSFKAAKLTLAQQLAAALKKCRSSYKHSSSKRAACERKAHATYTAKALAECRKSEKRKAKARASCEATARKEYSARSVASAERRGKKT